MAIQPLAKFLSLSLLSFSLSAQSLSSKQFILPADKTEANLTIPIAGELPAAAKISVLPLLQYKTGIPLAAQPFVGKIEPTTEGGALKVPLSELYFWGDAQLRIQISPESLYTVNLLRGPSLSPIDVHVARGQSASLWLYNFDTQPLKIRWRIIAGTDSICGFDASGQPRSTDCNSPDKWPEATLGPVRSDPLTFGPPDSWFSLVDPSYGAFRHVQLELRFGDGAAAPLQRIPFTLYLEHPRQPEEAFVFHLFRVIFWVTLGAALLMLAQVMIPNFRSCLLMESQADAFADDLRAVDSTVGSRIFSRCLQELNTLRRGLGMRHDAGSADLKSVRHSLRRVWLRLALSGNTAEVNRLQAAMPKMESRIRLTQRLDQRASALQSDAAEIPATLFWDREKQIHTVQNILSGQIMADADALNAGNILDLLAKDPASLIKDFSEELEKRVAVIQKQFTIEPWKTDGSKLFANVPGCSDLLQPAAGNASANLSLDQTIDRDICAIRLETIIRFIGLEPLLQLADPAISAGILQKVRSITPARLSSALCDLLSVSEGVSESDIVVDLSAGLWDAEWEPVDPTHQDVIRISLQLRNRQNNRATVRNTFKCSWHIKTESGEDYYEEGWEARFLLPPGINLVEPVVQDQTGKTVKLLSEELKPKDPISMDVRKQESGTVASRAVRGVIDALITALVPVITVAFTQFQNGGDITIVKLVLLGFTSQAIRAAVLPDSGSVTAK